MDTAARAPLDAATLQAALDPSWARVQVVEQTASTNADLLTDAGAPDRSVLVAEFQSAGRGRLDRSWSSPPRAGLTFSVLLRPGTPVGTWGWLPLLAGVAVHSALSTIRGVEPALKWPNDVLAGPQRAKLGGILSQAEGGAVVVGIGLNISTTGDELPVPGATSVAICGGGQVDRTGLLVMVLSEFDRRYSAWLDAAGDAGASGLGAEYRAVCATVGQDVVVTIGDEQLAGTARGISERGALLVAGHGDETLTEVAAGDVTHVSRAS